jgi:hypothetical protein
LIFENLIAQKLIAEGTWVGLRNGDRAVIKRLAVQSVTKDNKIVAVDYSNNSTVKLDPDLIAEIDGMKIERFLAQADLNSRGEKITGIKRRGRKPKNPRPQ